MKSSPRFLATALSCLAIFTSSNALELRSYDSAVHDRFIGFPESPSFNPSFLLESDKHAGIGWGSENPQKQFALISRCHVVFAAHNSPPLGSRISFLSTSGTVVERSVAEIQSVTNPTGSTSDVALITLSAPIEADEGVVPLPFLKLPQEADYLELPIVVLGSEAKAGEGELVDFRTINVNWIVSRTYRFDYLNTGGDSDDARLSAGDSGSPSLVAVDGVPALLGVHLATSNQEDVQSNYDAFIPHYVDQINALIAAAGFRMRPHNAESTEISCPSWQVSPDPAQGRLLEVEFSLMNAGDHPAGNLELRLDFAEGTGPDSVDADGWVASGSGTQWTLRRALLEPASDSLIRIGWASAPDVDCINPEIQWSSDSSAAGSLSKSIHLTPGFSAWASELAESGELDDPDKDGTPNIIEYAFGSDPLSAGGGDDGTVPPSPTFEVRDGIATYSHPERTDSGERGLVYTPEWSADPGQPWSTEAPAGLISTTTPYPSGIPGFVERKLSWPVAGPRGFIRLNVSE